jgi:hypothetical protein
MNWRLIHFIVREFYVVERAYVHYFTIQGKKKSEGKTGDLSMWLFEGIQLIFACFLTQFVGIIDSVVYG